MFIKYEPWEEVDYCCRCQAHEAPLYDNDKVLHHFKGSLYCHDCLFDMLYRFEPGLNFILQDPDLTEAFDEHFGDYQGAALEILRFDYNDNDNLEVRDFCKTYIEEFADWMEDNPKILPLDVLHNNLLSSKPDRKGE
ncbi:MAG: hypothetical protein IJ091_11270 [Oscillospiraceae bacterium]|nr:hypothetical protein [Oscillospiraceae bacterium]MBQ8996379.1 hypothetical protein [Oscillospiraceae bacterium]